MRAFEYNEDTGVLYSQQNGIHLYTSIWDSSVWVSSATLENNLKVMDFIEQNRECIDIWHHISLPSEEYVNTFFIKLKPDCNILETYGIRDL